MANPKWKIGSGEAQRFDQKNTGYSRGVWDPVMLEAGSVHHGGRTGGDRPGHTLKDWAFVQASWYVERQFAKGSRGVGDFGLFQWYVDPDYVAKLSNIAPGLKYEVLDPAQMSRDVKAVAKSLGACLVGICKLDHRWVYSHRFHRETLEHSPLQIPPEFEHAIVMAHEMDYELMKFSPSYTSLATTADCYSQMPFVAGRLAHFIRALGYKALPCGNDTALSIPLAIDAGLGQLGRNGLLITERFGPRVRLSKVFTDLPLVPDKPIEFGVTEFCNSCRRCAENCPGRAISFGEPTTEPINISSSGGLLKWYIDAEKCFTSWTRINGGSCANCIRVCPFNKPTGWLHDSARFLVTNAPWLDPALVWLDKALGYGERAKPEEFWR
jgi:epoxyqueuosine reductase